LSLRAQYLAGLLLAFSLFANSQDPQFSQFYANQLYLAPLLPEQRKTTALLSTGVTSGLPFPEYSTPTAFHSTKQYQISTQESDSLQLMTLPAQAT